jgi:hypothetical protein
MSGEITMIKTLKTLKEKLDKTIMTPAEKYWYLAGALDFIFEENNINLEIEIEKTLQSKKEPEKKPAEHAPFAPQIKPQSPSLPSKKLSVENCKIIIMNTLPMGAMSVNEMIGYNNIKLDCNIYQMMNTAANLLSYDHKIVKKQKTKCRGTQYEYSLPSDMPTKIVLNGDMVEQQRRV